MDKLEQKKQMARLMKDLEKLKSSFLDSVLQQDDELKHKEI
jgi:hypothetical protein